MGGCYSSNSPSMFECFLSNETLANLHSFSTRTVFSLDQPVKMEVMLSWTCSTSNIREPIQIQEGRKEKIYVSVSPILLEVISSGRSMCGLVWFSPMAAPASSFWHDVVHVEFRLSHLNDQWQPPVQRSTILVLCTCINVRVPKKTLICCPCR